MTFRPTIRYSTCRSTSRSGAHVSLFALLMAITLLINTKMTGGMDRPQQPGCPNAKFLMYLIPVMMLLVQLGRFRSVVLLYALHLDQHRSDLGHPEVLLSTRSQTARQDPGKPSECQNARPQMAAQDGLNDETGRGTAQPPAAPRGSKITRPTERGGKRSIQKDEKIPVWSVWQKSKAGKRCGRGFAPPHR